MWLLLHLSLYNINPIWFYWLNNPYTKRLINNNVNPIAKNTIAIIRAMTRAWGANAIIAVINPAPLGKLIIKMIIYKNATLDQNIAGFSNVLISLIIAIVYKFVK